MFNLTKLALLWEWVGELKNNVALLLSEIGPTGENLLPSRSTATTGQILKLTGENKTPNWADEYSYTPPAYSETEVNTGKKWINGKDVYCKVLSGTTSDTTSGTEVIGSIDFDNMISFTFYYKDGLSIRYTNILVAYLNGSLSITKNQTIAEKQYHVVVYYTKPDPAPETRDDDTPEEPETKKTTKKRSSK